MNKDADYSLIMKVLKFVNTSLFISEKIKIAFFKTNDIPVNFHIQSLVF